jgi:glycosyltransferase involved in cell wall biosynthesis
MDDRWSVCHILAPGVVGGLETVVAALAAGMARRGHRVRMLPLLEINRQCVAFDALQEAGVEVVPIRCPPRSYRAEVKRVRAELETAPGAVAHSHGYHGDLVGFFAGRAAGVPLVATSHGFTGGGFKNRLYEWFDRRALARFDAVVAVSRPLADRLEAGGVAASRIHVVPNAFAAGQGVRLARADARRELGLGPDELVLGWIGRFSREKGPDILLEALALAPEWNGSLIGCGPLQRDLQRRVEQLGLIERVRWHGVIPEVSRLVGAFDAVVLSSRSEGTPMVLLEAMAAGVPLVVTAVGGVPDVVGPEEAILIPPERPDLLALALRNIRENPGPARARALAAMTRLDQQYSLDPWLDRYEMVYRSCRG